MISPTGAVFSMDDGRAGVASTPVNAGPVVGVVLVGLAVGLAVSKTVTTYASSTTGLMSSVTLMNVFDT